MNTGALAPVAVHNALGPAAVWEWLRTDLRLSLYTAQSGMVNDMMLTVTGQLETL